MNMAHKRRTLLPALVLQSEHPLQYSLPGYS